MSERIVDGLDAGVFLRTDLYGRLLTEYRQVKKALMHRPIHVLDQSDILVRLVVLCHRGCGPKPFPVVPDIQIITTGRQSTGVHRKTPILIFCLDCDDFRVGPESHRKTGGHPYLSVLAFCETFEFHRVNPMVRVRCVRHEFANHCEVRGLRERIVHLFVLRRGGQNSQRQRQR